jgi:DNA modification methylase
MKVEIGNATLYRGDCLELLPALRADVMVTDPPYGIDANSNWQGKHGDCSIAGDATTLVRDEALRLANVEGAIIFGSWKRPKPLGTKAVLIWDKSERSGMGDLKFPWKPNSEEIYVIGDGFVSERRDSSVLRYTPHLPCVGNVRETDHPYQKPLDLMSYLISKTVGTVLDAFMGSGTTGVACAGLDRKFIGIEINETYFDIACSRIEAAYAQGRLFA